jgi:hypothetical protein
MPSLAKGIRQLIETVNGQLVERFKVLDFGVFRAKALRLNFNKLHSVG